MTRRVHQHEMLRSAEDRRGDVSCRGTSNGMRIGWLVSLLFCVTIDSSVTCAISRNTEENSKKLHSSPVLLLVMECEYLLRRRLCEARASGCRVCLVLWLCTRASPGYSSVKHRSNYFRAANNVLPLTFPRELYSARSATSPTYRSSDVASEERPDELTCPLQPR